MMKSILLYGAETRILKQKCKNKLLVKEMDYLRRSAKNPIIRQNIGKTNTIIQESEEAKIR